MPQRLRSSATESDGGAEYAEEYSRRERIRLVLIALCIAIPLFVVAQLWAWPALHRFSAVAHCRGVLGVNGSAFPMYAIFVGLPSLLALVVGVPMLYTGIRVIADRQYPPRGKKTLRPTRIRRGRPAAVIGCLHMLPLLLCIAVAAWEASVAQAFFASTHNARTTHGTCVPDKPVARVPGASERR